ncbi:MAG TPA: DUF1697 domain-containing protein [Thermomicrobiales bacterium]|nr:DUF1697 domain-containing protein [Thermomicrobiales bacterium]
MNERYVAFLRAINVGGHRIIKMADLKAAMLEAGFANAQTYIASGNVLFEHPSLDQAAIASALEQLIAARYGFSVEVMLRTHAEIRDMVDRNPFGHVQLGKEVTGYVTLLYHAPTAATSRAIEALSNDVETLVVRGSEVLTTYYRARGKTEQVTGLEKKLKLVGTTRNWNTIVKLAGMARAEG